MSRFIKLNHGIVDADLIVGVSDPFWTDVEVKPRKNTKKKPGMGITKAKTKKAYGFSVILRDNNKVTTYPTVSPLGAYSTNTKRLTLQVHQEIIRLIQNEDETKDNIPSTSKVNRRQEKLFDYKDLQEANEKG
jgi:hypothetical protein